MTVPFSEHVFLPVTLVARNPRQALRHAEGVLSGAPAPEARSTALRLMGLAQRELGDTESAHRLLRRSASVAERARLFESAALARVSRLGLQALHGGGGVLGASLDRMTGGNRSTKAFLLVHKGVAAAQRGRFDTAIAGFDAARELLRPQTDDRMLAGLLSNRGLALMYTGRFPEAGTDLRHALALTEDHTLDHLRGLTLQNLGCLAVRDGDIARAVSRFAGADQLVPASRRASLRLDHAEALLTAGMAREAASLLSSAPASGRALATDADDATARLLKAKIHLSRGERDAAASQARRVRFGFTPDSLWAQLACRLERAAASSFGHPPPRAPAGHGTTGTASMRGGLRVVPASAFQTSPSHPAPGRPATAPETASPAAAGADRLLAHCVTGTPLGPPSLIALEPRHRTALRALAGHDHQGAHRALLRAPAHPGSRASTRHLELQVHGRAQDREVSRVGAEVALRAGNAATALDWIEYGRALTPPPDQCRDGAWGWLLERCRAAHARMCADDDTALEELRRLAPRLGTAQWHRGCSTGASAASPSGPAEPVAAELSAVLGDHVFVCFTHTRRGAAAITVADGVASAHDLAPVADIADAVAKLLHAARSAAISPEGRERGTSRPGALVERLLLAPVAAVSGTRPLVIAPAPYAQDLPWGMLPGLRGRAVTVVPSGRSWLDCRNRAIRRGRRPRRVLLAAGRDLAGATTEVESLRPRYPGATVLTGPAARVPDVLRELGRADLAHLSAHGSAPADTPMLSGIFLADGPLFAYDLERLPSFPVLTVLSSCWVGRCAPSPSGFPLGLSTSLLAMGGATVVAGVLPVSDGETTPAMLRLHDALTAGVSPARAVSDHLADAGFVCFGAG